MYLCARSSAWIERWPPEPKATGSNPVGRVSILLPFSSQPNVRKVVTSQIVVESQSSTVLVPSFFFT